MKKVKVGVSGCLGRMGQDLAKQLKFLRGIEFVGGFDLKNKKNFINNIFFKANVIIDFSSPSAITSNLEMALNNNTGLVIGTTGLKEKEYKMLNKASKKIPILISSNMSLGVNVLFNLVQQTASTLKDNDYDIEIAETHHKHKIDAPSGTALSLGEYAAKGRKTNFQKVKVLDRTSKNLKRKKGKIGFSVTRGGEIAGEHTVSFIGTNDRIDLVHKANNRSIFVDGAIEAAIFVSKKKNGFFNMHDLLFR
ncbi:MAG: 4-hydroxy-tetrahydrodipicolinate reductase [Alphaproteobacteria bacterium MarineAlpha5_Bin8]|nr:MAG: 4-hydroxy-tetrahydrodipicolinate reductase [Alphaproteobacteria bacterium MarineAlpha5_Bin7]PPR48148.1 MAG: 4-hydroxy-tetrahydrodipicolinate reductase [Alphaproteobacteria bacterium MarineAlpha5_Bin8]PPR54723.1 MAG: 4-hydroxy-tetrahydrodipicolinate reductase [Alphaproteobacteria bacterium MarineAlpha5_Bin6]